MKRFFALLLCAAMLLSMGACRRDIPPAPTDPVGPTDATEPTAPPDPKTLVEAMGTEAGYENAFAELSEISAIESSELHYTRFQQHYQGLPVYGRQVICVTDANGDVLAVTGNPLDVSNLPDMTPSVTVQQVQSAVDTVAAAEISALSDADLCIYDLNGTTHLAYLLQLHGYDILVDAHSAAVLSAVQTILSNVETTGYASSDTERAKPITVEENAGVYYLQDPKRNITVFDLDQRNSDDLSDFTAPTITSTDNIFGSEDHETADTAAKMLYLVSRFYDFAETILGADSNWSDLRVAYNDSFDDGNNARGGFNHAGYGILATGTNTGVDDIDILAHEYGHVISYRVINWTNHSVETKAINEAFSDIFGTIAEAWINEWDEPDWDLQGDNISVHRSMSNPTSTGNAAFLDEPANPQRGSGYYYSTLLSHATYMMHACGISELDLLQIWYHTLLMMPPDCSFLECKELMELAARNMNYSQEYQQFIHDAFTTVGIVTPEIPNMEIGPQATVNVLDYYGSIYDDYSLRLWRISDQIHGSLVNLYPTKCHPAAHTVMTTTDPYTVPFSEGVYLLEITDNANTNVKELVFLSITDQGPAHVDIPTAFGIVSLDDLMPILEAFESCYAMYYGVQMDEENPYRQVFASLEDSYEGKFVSLEPWDSISWADSRDALELPVYKVTNFDSLEDVDAYLAQYFTPKFVEKHFRMMMEYRLAMYENQLYWVGHNMGDPPPMDLPNAELEATSARACTVSVKSGYAGYLDERHTFYFEKTADGWRMTHWETEYL